MLTHTQNANPERRQFSLELLKQAKKCLFWKAFYTNGSEGMFICLSLAGGSN